MDSTRLGKKVRVGKALPPHIYKEVCKVLIDFQDVLSWIPTDSGTISQDIVEHHLGIPEGAQLMIQKRRISARQR